LKTLRLRLCPLAELGADSTIEFEVVDERRSILERGRAVAASLPRLPRTELVVAAPDVLLVEAAVPPLSGARLRAALQSVAEPHLLCAVEGAYVVGVRGAAGGQSAIAILDRALFQRALELLRRVKIRPASATPEQLALPLHPGRWRMRAGPAHGCLRTDELTGIACSPAQGAEPPVELRLALEQAGGSRPQAIEVEGRCDAEAWEKALGVPVVPVAPAERAERPRLELLQYELAPHVVDWRAARLPLALAAACALVWITGLNVEAWTMLREERALRAAMDAAVREAFPKTPVILDAPKQMRRGVAELRGSAGLADPRDFLPLAASLARALAPEAETVRALEFRDQALRVELEPRAVDSPKKRAALLEQLNASGLAGTLADGTLTVRTKGKGP
jgi:general secretion pathway protein L